ncbi:MAG: aspartyl-phosphate phosphatase Spo0E family protein [Bacillota bacterium]
MSNNNDSEKVSKKIKEMRKELIQEFNKKRSFSADSICKLSQKLDQEIMKYMKNQTRG